MVKRVTILLLAMVLLVGAILPCIPEGQAAYENTHTNTGNQRADIIAIALTQVGYTEGAGGYTKYGEFHGNPYADWCGYFVSWCARQAGVSTSVLKKQGWAAASKWGLSTFTASQRTPQPGDLYFRGTAHVGFVYYVSGSKFYTLEGNTVGDAVASRCLDLYSYTFASPNYGGSNNASHTHNMQYYCEDAHPHKEYKKCTGCGYTVYTGANQIKDSCQTCIQENCSHNYSAWESVGSSKHQRTCSKCGLVQTAEHGWEDRQILQEPTCGTAGSKVQYCSACGDERTVTIPKTDAHRYSVWESDGANTHSRVCAVCGDKEAVSHEWVDVKITKEATCKETGTKEQKCSVCGEERVAVIPKSTEHQYGEWSYADPAYHTRTCQTCGIRNNGEHNVNEDVWATDGQSHWHECADCKEKYEVEDHVFSGDCVSPCDICGFVRAEGHNYGGQWYSDGEKHWQTCLDCGAKSLPKKHTYDNECDAFCNECGYERDAGHTVSETVFSDATAHWQECETCGEILNYEKHIGGEAATEEHGQFCTACGYEMMPALEHIHQYKYYGSGQSHVGICECGHKLAVENHSWDFATGKCSLCGVDGVKDTDSSQNWDFVWLILAGAVTTTTVVTTVVMVRSIKKRKRGQEA